MNLHHLIFLRGFATLLLGFALFHLFLGVFFDDWFPEQSQVITYAIVGLSVPLGHWGSCKKRIKYLYSHDFRVPQFKDSLPNAIQINSPGFSWKEFENRLGEEFIITAHQNDANAFKLRTRLSWNKPGAAAYLTYDENAGTLKCCYFSFPGYIRSGTRAIQRMNKDIVELAWQTGKS
ncbi:hypothetical protein [Marinilabilia rubra]|uniref:Uncharacterized protein n=1 Tax=Marinilabilia rubra TaxID=2162893 RepID=A0A2U2BD35_9BACT|nr:hypothetical protein [Marinilabilia rubra]PWE00985.1 hypothetical protein DDZ16_00405 [Marinilabilia rubra]